MVQTPTATVILGSREYTTTVGVWGRMQTAKPWTDPMLLEASAASWQ
jgi:hypothetical protein